MCDIIEGFTPNAGGSHSRHVSAPSKDVGDYYTNFCESLNSDWRKTFYLFIKRKRLEAGYEPAKR